MRNTIRTLVIVIIAAGCLNFFSTAHCENDGQWGKEIKTMKCLISRVDLIENELTVNGVEEVKFLLYPDVRAYKGDSDIGLPDLKVGTHVVVEYYYTSSNEPRLISIKEAEGD